MTRLLLDTEAFIWWDAGDRRLGRHAREAVKRAGEVYVSAASAWEIAIKTALGKVRTTHSAMQAVADGDFRELRSHSSTRQRSATCPPTTAIRSIGCLSQQLGPKVSLW